MHAQISMPDRVTDISLEWLREATAGHAAFARDPIHTFRSASIGSGIGQVGECALLDVEQSSGSTRRLFAKWPTPLASMNEVARTYHMYEREVRFYQQLASRVPARTPEIYFAHFDPVAHSVGLIMEAFDGWRSPDQIAGASRREVELAIDQLVLITAALWDSNLDLEWLPTCRTGYIRQLGADYRACTPEFLDRFESRLPANIRTLLYTIGHGFERLLDHLAVGHRVLTHFDYRVENMFFSPAGEEMIVIDWQLVMWMRPGWDFAYLVCNNLTVEDRRAWFGELADRYFEGLRRSGISGYSRQEFDHDVRSTLCGLTAISLIGGANADTNNPRSMELFGTAAERAFTAVNDLNAVSVLP